MSGGVDTERIGSVNLELNSVAQKVLGDQEMGIDTGGGGGGVILIQREDLLDQPHGNINGPSSTTSNNSKKRVRRHNHYHNNHYKKHQSLRKRIRRNTQPAPNNTNEFLMQEHDHLFHLDLDNEDDHAPGDPDDQNNVHVNVNHASYLSSSEDEDAFLNQDFSAVYDVVHQERLQIMSKPELITEYQLLEDRVESLERKLKSGLRTRPDLISPLPSPQPQVTLPIDLLSDDEKVRLVQEEVTSLREENRKLRADNKFLRKLFYSPSSTTPAVVNGGDDRISTDSGGGSGSDTATPEERNINKMIKRL